MLKVLSLNILAQHLIDGECPAYPLVNNNDSRQDLREIRTKNLVHFLTSEGMKDFDILNLQEIGPRDLEFINQTRIELE